MSRLLGVLTFAALLMSAGSAMADKRHPSSRRSVPELSTTGAATGLIVVGGAAAILLARRRARKP